VHQQRGHSGRNGKRTSVIPRLLDAFGAGPVLAPAPKSSWNGYQQANNPSSC